MTYVGVVGSRYPNISYDEFKALLSHHLRKYVDITIISGEAVFGIDTYAMRFTRELGVAYIGFNPNMFKKSPHTGKGNRYFRRNELIATACEVLIAFPSKDDLGFAIGGTLNTINHAERLNRKVIVL